MNSRRCKRSGSAEDALLSFVEVKEEPNEQLFDYNDLLQQAEVVGKSSESVNKNVSESRTKMPENKESKTHYKRSRATQVNSEDIDMLNVRRSDILNTHAENKPIKAIGTESIIPQCRFCLRRVSRENLKIILRKQSTKALAAFQIRVFHHDAYPLACSNCLNMIDIILDYRSAVTKARNLLLDKRMHLENDGWDDPANIECFNQCKSAVEQHRMQIDAIYDEHMAREERRNTQILEPKPEFSVENHETPGQSDNINDIQNAPTQNTINDDLTVELALESGIMEVENVLKAHVADSSLDSGNLIDAGEVFELSAENPKTTAPDINPSVNENDVSHHKRRKVKEIKVYYSSESDQNVEDEDYNPAESNSSENDDDDVDYTPAPLTSKQKTFVKSETEQETSEISEPKKRKYRKRSKESRQSKMRTKEKKPRKPRKPRESVLNRPPDYKPPSIQPVLCDLCGESVRPETIEGHRNRHLGIKPYNCPIEGCDWTFHGRANLSNHLRRMHPENGVQALKCDVCGKFIRGKPGILNEHKKLHFLKEKSYVCPVCGKGFTLNRYLRQHSVIHTGLFPYECSYCGKKFNNKWSMKTHEKNMHEKKNQGSTSYDPAMDAEQTDQAYVE
ncbi:AAEL010302-PA [Aedes aegypti]|uniref:AAEL010302-PA n=2 Tax=Aedes aegypti TaxID=7159 RepID=A0A1S4FPW7_AEDAE|nr:zinc finger and SCAN domain-containing protein 31 [Aedes aegypti]EAT37738.1 AAEL010302-PA [Aedes aegypti]